MDINKNNHGLQKLHRRRNQLSFLDDKDGISTKYNTFYADIKVSTDKIIPNDLTHRKKDVCEIINIIEN